jgi:hypothetical protein
MRREAHQHARIVSEDLPNRYIKTAAQPATMVNSAQRMPVWPERLAVGRIQAKPIMMGSTVVKSPTKGTKASSGLTATPPLLCSILLDQYSIRVKPGSIYLASGGVE